MVELQSSDVWAASVLLLEYGQTMAHDTPPGLHPGIGSLLHPIVVFFLVMADL